MRLRGILIAVVSLMAFYQPVKASAGDFKATPSLTLGIEHNDNVFLERSGKDADYISKARPSLNLGYRAPSFNLGAGYSYDYRHYSRGVRDDTEAQDAKATVDAVLIDELLYLKASDVYTRTTLDSTRETTSENFDVNQSDRNTFILNPYLVVRLGPLSDLRLSYRRTATWYKEDTGIDKREAESSAEATRELSETTSVKAGYRYIEETDRTGGYLKKDAYAGFSYGREKEVGLSLTGGYSLLDPERGKSYGRMWWDAMFFKDLNAFKATLASGSSIVENPVGAPQWRMSHSLELAKRLERTSASLSFYLHEYRGMEEKRLQSRVYGNRASLSREITDKLKGTFDYTIEKTEHRLSHTHTLRSLVSPGLMYSISADDSLVFAYNYASYTSPEIDRDNYKNRRFSAELRLSF